MSIKVMSHVWEHSEQKGSRLLMLLAIADFADDFGVAFPGVDRLAKKTRMSERNAQMTLRALEAADELIIEKNRGAHTDHGNTNRYHLVSYQKSIGYERGEASFTPNNDGAKPTSPQGVKPVSPDGVKPTSPKPSVELSVEPSERESPAPIPALKVLPKAERKRLRAWVQHSERYADGALIDVTAPTFEDACNDLFYTWLDGLERAGCKPDTDIEELWSMSRVYAVSLAKNRRTVEQVTAYIDWIYSPTNPDKFYREPLKVLRLAAVSNSIGAWLKEKEKKSVRAAAPLTPSAPVVELTPAEIEQRRREVEEARKSFARGA